MNYKRIAIVLLILVIIASITLKCNNDKLNRLEGQYEVLKENYQVQKSVVSSLSSARQKEKDSLNFIISQREAQTEIQKKEISSLKSQVFELRNRPKKQPKGLDGLVTYFNERYQVNDNAIVSGKVGLTEDTATDVTWDLESGDIAIEIVPKQEEIIKKQDTVISNLEKDKVDISTILSSAENLIEEQKKLNDMANKNIENLESQVKKHKKKSFWNKVLIVGGSIGGFILGNSLSK